MRVTDSVFIDTCLFPVVTVEDTLENEGEVESGDCEFNCKMIKRNQRIT